MKEFADGPRPYTHRDIKIIISYSKVSTVSNRLGYGLYEALLIKLYVPLYSSIVLGYLPEDVRNCLSQRLRNYYLTYTHAYVAGHTCHFDCVDI